MRLEREREGSDEKQFIPYPNLSEKQHLSYGYGDVHGSDEVRSSFAFFVFVFFFVLFQRQV